MNRKLRQVGLITLLVLATATVAGCGADKAEENSAPIEAASEAVEVQDITEPIAEGPVVITSAGQSADFEICKTLMEKAELEYSGSAVLKIEELGDAKTLMIAVGGSTKGLGAAGIDDQEELERIDGIITEAKEKGITVISMHTGGKARRGELSDKFVNDVMPKSDYVIIVSEGDQDGLISGICQDNDIPMASVESISNIVEKLKNTFK